MSLAPVLEDQEDQEDQLDQDEQHEVEPEHTKPSGVFLFFLWLSVFILPEGSILSKIRTEYL